MERGTRERWRPPPLILVQAAINAGAADSGGSSRGTLAGAIAVSDAVQKLDAALHSLNGDREAVSCFLVRLHSRYSTPLLPLALPAL